MPLSKRLGVLAFVKQAAVGTPGAAPAYNMPIVSGGIKPQEDISELPSTRQTMMRAGVYRQRVRGQGTVTVLALPNPLGLLLYEVMGFQSAAATVHTFTMADAFPLPLTVWSLVGDDWWRFSDCYVTKMVLRGATGDNCLVDLDLLAFGVRRTTLALAMGTETPRFKYIGGTVQLEADTATPQTMTNVEDVALTIDRTPDVRYGSSLTPVLIQPIRNVDFSAHVVYDTSGGNQGWDFLAAHWLGAVAATGDVTQAFAEGSFNVTFGKHPSTYSGSLAISSPGSGANWSYAVDRPDADPGGGALEYDLNGMVREPAAGGPTEVTVVLTNDVSGVY